MYLYAFFVFVSWMQWRTAQLVKAMRMRTTTPISGSTSKELKTSMSWETACKNCWRVRGQAFSFVLVYAILTLYKLIMLVFATLCSLECWLYPLKPVVDKVMVGCTFVLCSVLYEIPFHEWLSDRFGEFRLAEAHKICDGCRRVPRQGTDLTSIISWRDTPTQMIKYFWFTLSFCLCYRLFVKRGRVCWYIVLMDGTERLRCALWLAYCWTHTTEPLKASW